MAIHSSLDDFPDYRKNYDGELLKFIESQITDKRRERLREVASRRTRYLTLVAENLVDEFNIHAMIRTSECFGLQDFHNIGLENQKLKPNKSVTKGSLKWTHIYNYTSKNNATEECIQHLRTKGYRIYATALEGDIEYTPDSIPIDKPVAVIMGTELHGISDTAREMSDGILKVPMYGFTESFNVSVATALASQPIIHNIRKSTYPWSLNSSEIDEMYYEWVWHTIRKPDMLYDNWLKRNKK